VTTEAVHDASAVAAEPKPTATPVVAQANIEDVIGPEPPDEETQTPSPNGEPISLAERGANVGTEKEKQQKQDEEDDVLDLTSIIPSRKLVRIPTHSNPLGEVHELRLLDDFGIEEQQQLLGWSRRFEALWNKEGKDLTPRERVKMKWLLNAMFFRVLDAPDEVKRDVDDTIKSRVVTAFTMVPLLERQKRENEKEQEEEDDDIPAEDLPTTAS
jgi:hypothetical protein